jgi:tetratricopeptide (TPR) repeat protein
MTAGKRNPLPRLCPSAAACRCGIGAPRIWRAAAMSDVNKSKIAEQLFSAGSDAVRKGNLDYAIDCFLKCTKLAPDRLVYRQALRGAEYKQYGDNKKGAAMAGLRMAPLHMKLKTAKARKKWADVVAAAEEALKLNPWDVPTLYELAQACKELGFSETGVWVLETAVAVDKSSADVYRLLGDLYEHVQQFDKALSAFAMVRKLDPTDQEASARERQLAAQATMKKGKYEDASSFRDSLQSPARAGGETDASATDPHARIRREIAELEAKLQPDASNANLCVQIADKYRLIKDWGKAAELYSRGFQATGQHDLDIKAKMLDCQIGPYREKLHEVNEQIAAVDKTTPDAAEKLRSLRELHRKLETAIVKREIDWFAVKTESNPDDAEAFYQLGYRKLRLGQVDDAIVCLQKGRHDARHKWEALLWLGYAFWEKKNFTLADKNLADALGTVPPNDESAKKQVLYYRGRVAEDRGNRDEAMHFYNEIAAMDYAYKDVAKRLDALTNQLTGQPSDE